MRTVTTTMVQQSAKTKHSLQSHRAEFGICPSYCVDQDTLSIYVELGVLTQALVDDEQSITLPLMYIVQALALQHDFSKV